jgi:membrane protease YdiL (CAAX protease family)
VDPADSGHPDATSALPTGPHPVIGPTTVRMPGWPGPALIVAGALLALGALVAGSMIAAGNLRVSNPTGVLAIGVGGVVAFTAGLVYVAVRQIRVRRFLPPERYRGPSILSLVALTLVLANVVSLPFAEDAAALVLGQGELSTVGTIVLLVSTQGALLAVTWAFVHLPRALAGLPRFPGADVGRSVRLGLLWGAGAWLGASLLANVIALGLEALGIEPDLGAAERALAMLDPWLLVVPIVIIAPIAEELFFRGVVFNALRREATRRWAYLGSALLFSVIHLSPVTLLPIFLLGLVLARVYERTGSLLAPIVLHATFNGLSVTLALLARYEVIRLPV